MRRRKSSKPSYMKKITYSLSSDMDCENNEEEKSNVIEPFLPLVSCSVG